MAKEFKVFKEDDGDYYTVRDSKKNIISVQRRRSDAKDIADRQNRVWAAEQRRK